MKNIKLFTSVLLLCLLFSCKKESNNVDINQHVTDTLIKKTDVILDENNQTNKSHIIKSGVQSNCHEELIKLLKSSSDYQKNTKGLEKAIIKNGGIGILININKVENKFYYTVLENYSDHTSKISDYVFDISTKKLFKKDFIIDNLTEIDYDHKILREINIYCI